MSFLGPLYAYLLDPDVVNIEVTSADRIFVERYGRSVVQVPETMRLEDRMALIGVLSTHAGVADLDDGHSRLACDLPFGFRGRVQAFSPPVSPGWPIIIRIHAARVFTLDNYVTAGDLSAGHRAFLREATQQKLNVIVSGEQNSGKSTFLNALLHEQSAVWPLGRTIILQDRDELQPSAANTDTIFYDVEQIRYVDGRPMRYMYRLQDALPDALRLRTEFLAIGETRDGATTIGLLAAANTGTRGLKSTLHSNGCRDTVDRIEDLVLVGGQTPVRRSITRLAEVLVHMGIDPVTRRRRVLDIQRVLGVDASREYVFGTLSDAALAPA